MKQSKEKEYFKGLLPEEKLEYLFIAKQNQSRNNTWLNVRVILAYVVIAILFFTLFDAFKVLMYEVAYWHPIDSMQIDNFNYTIDQHETYMYNE